MCVTMAASVSSQFPNMDKNEAAYAEFIKEKIEKAGGQIKFQHITGHLSQLSLGIRQTVGASPHELRKFLKKHNEIFTVDSEGFVTFQKSPVITTEKKKQNSRVDNDSNTNDSESPFPMSIKEVPGIVIKVLPTFGFIAIKDPLKTSVYFTPACVVDKKFEIKDEKGLLLTDIPDMLPGKKVLINAKKANTNFEAKYRATRVWTPPNVKNQVLVPEGFKPRVPKDGLYDPLSIEGSGKVQNVFEQFGFITNETNSENVFFHKSKVQNVQNIMNLAKVFSPGDLVEFKAIRSTKKDIKVRWEASKVWIKKQGKTNLFKTDSSGIGSSECDTQQKNVQQKNSPKPLEVLDSEPGKIFPHTDGVVIKFGKNDTNLADADSCPFYLHGAKVQDVCWEFSDGDKVQFDGRKIKSAPGWKAMLAWVGVRPNIVLPTQVGDFTEFSDDDNASVNEKNIPYQKPKVVRPAGFSRQPKRGQNSKSSDRTRIFTPSPGLSQVSNSSSRSVSKSHSSVDKDYDLLSEDTMSTLSGESQSQTSGHHRRRHRRSRYNSSKPIHKVNSYSSLTDDAALESGDSYTTQDSAEFHNSEVRRDDVGSNILSQATLKPSLSFESLDLKTCLKPNPDLYQNWGDTPYPEDDCKDVCPATEENTHVTTNTDKQFMKSPQINPVSNNTAEKIPSKPKRFSHGLPIMSSDSDQDNGNVDAEVKSQELGNNTAEKIPSKPKSFSNGLPIMSSDSDQDNENADKGVKSQELSEDIDNSPVDIDALPVLGDIDTLADIINLTDSEKETGKESKLSPYVKCFFDLEGTIVKVFCKYAEIEHSKLMKSISVLWNDLYHNGVPVADKFDDMKEVIKSGQSIKFNCIEIVDDDGACWQKVTIAWKGQKPKVKDITPQEYIKQNYLHVSVKESDIDYGTRENSSQPKIPLNITAEPAVLAPPRKFLSIAYSDDESEPDLSSSVEGERCDASQLDAEKTLPEENRVMSEDEEDDLAEAVGGMISSFITSQVDIRALSSNIINLVRSRTVAPKSEKLQSKSLTESEVIVYYKEDEISPTDSLPLKPRNEMKDSDTQTIITGEVIAQSLFTNRE